MNQSLNEQTACAVNAHSLPELISVRRFSTDLGIVPSTCWRWIQRGWLSQPLNIGGRLYLTREQIAEFKRRAEAGEFAAHIKPGRSTKSI